MNPKIAKEGQNTYGALAYLYGPGRWNEHTDPHLVASFDGLAPDPGSDPAATLKQLQTYLELPVKAIDPERRPTKHVWHCSVRAAPEDRQLADEEWAQIARRVAHATGIAEHGDDGGCRWAAIRHADDHIHIVATKVRQDGARPKDSYSYKRVQAECRRIEADFGLRRQGPGDGTAAKHATGEEVFKARRVGRERPARDELREAVRGALAGAASEEEFAERLAATGVRVKWRTAPSGDRIGYGVALPGDRNRDGAPIWFSGSTLAPDLSLPKIRRRLTQVVALNSPEASQALTGQTRRGSRPAQARVVATGAAEDLALILLNGTHEAGAGAVVGFGELLDATAQTAAAPSRAELRAAAQAFERATRSHIRAERAAYHAARSAARGIVYAGQALGRGEDGGATAMLLSTLVLVTIAAARWHAAHGHTQQAAAARQAADHLRTAYKIAADAPMAAARQRSRRLPDAVRHQHEQIIERLLPAEALRMRAAPGWHELTATLEEVRQAGGNPQSTLEAAVEMRELDTADSISDVLVWRLRRLGDLPAAPRSRRRTSHIAKARRTDAAPLPTDQPHTDSRPPRR